MKRKNNSKMRKLINGIGFWVGFLLVPGIASVVLVVPAEIPFVGNDLAKIVRPAISVSATNFGRTGEDGSIPAAASIIVDDGGYEYRWRSGENVAPTPPSDASPEFADGMGVQDYLRQIPGIDPEINVVVTRDKSLNCGVNFEAPIENDVSGCYSNVYGKTVFFSWGEQTSKESRLLVLLHEYSHYTQYNEHFDFVVSARQDTAVNQDDVTQIIETDATCRVYNEWGFESLRSYDVTITSPCGDTKWDKNYLENELAALGVEKHDW